MKELNLPQILYLAETLLQQQPERPMPVIKRSQEKPLTFWFSGMRSIPPIDSEEQDLDHLVGKTELRPWHAEADFSGDCIIYLCATAAELEQQISQLFELEHGIRPAFTLRGRLIGRIAETKQYVCLLYLSGLHSYMPFVDWLKNPQSAVVYYRYTASRQRRMDDLFAGGYPSEDEKIGGVYVQWKFELAGDISGFDRYYKSNSRLILLGEEPSNRYLLADAPFLPLLDLFKVNVEPTFDLTVVTPQLPEAAPGLQLTVGPLRDSRNEILEHLQDSSLLKFDMTLRSGYGTLEYSAANESSLQEQIEYLQLQLAKARLDKEAKDLSDSALYLYEELPDHPFTDGLDHLRQFIVRQPEWHLKNFAYQRLEIGLAAGKSIFHLVRLPESDAMNPAALNPPVGKYQFYFEKRWSNVTGYKIYLPVDNAGRPMEFYPALLPTSEEMAQKFKPALGVEDYPLGSTLLLWPDPWPDGQTIKAMLRIVIPAWKNLSEAQQFINIRAIKAAIPTVPQPAESLALLRTKLYSGASVSDTAEKEAIRIVEAAWNGRKDEIRAFISEANKALKEAADAAKRKAEVENLFGQIEQLRKKEHDDWAAFVAAVLEMDKEINSYPHTVSGSYASILSSIRHVHEEGRKELNNLMKAIKQELSRGTKNRSPHH